MALNQQQITGLNALNARIAGGYKPTSTDLANLNYAKSQGYSYQATPAIPQQLNSGQLTSGYNITPVQQQGVDTSPFVASLGSSNQSFENLIKTIMTPSSAEQQITPITQRINDLTGQYQLKPNDYQSELSKYGFQTSVNDLQGLNTQLAATKAAYDKFAVGQEGRTASAASIYGRQALAQRQAATELGGLSAMAQALQGNITMAQDIAQKTTNLKYEPLEQEIANQKYQLEQVYNQLSVEDKRKADAVKATLDERQRLITEKKNTDDNINSVMMTAAQNGADSATLNKIMKSKTLSEAIINSGQYIKSETLGKWTTFKNDNTGEIYKINSVTGETQNISNVSTNLGNQVGEIMGLPSYDTRANNPGVNRSDRNLNPGNIKVSDYTKGFDGVIGVESRAAADGGNFLIFDSAESGIKAIGRLLSESSAYNGLTAEKAIKKYNGNGGYGAKDVGLDPTKDFKSQISDPMIRDRVAKSIAQLEGFSGGNSNVSQSAMNWAKQINDGKATLANVPPKERSSVVDALAQSGDISKTDAAITETLNNKVSQIDELINKVSTDGKNVVGPTGVFGRFSILNTKKLSGKEQAFVGSVKQLISKETLDTLINLKRAGGTLGALSDQERIMLQNAATKIGGWEKKDKNGVGIGIWSISESEFKKELENMKKLTQTAISRASGGTGIVSIDPLDISTDTSNSTNPLGL